MSPLTPAARLAARATPTASPAVVVGFLDMAALVVLFALAFALVPPILAALLWFPALGLTGWPLVGASAAAFLVWGVFLKLLQRRNK